MSRYIVYGISVESDVDLPGIFEAPGGSIDVRIRQASGALAADWSEPAGLIDREGEGTYLRIWETATFLIREGREIHYELAPAGDERVLRLCLVGQVVALLMAQRGKLVLHGSAVSVGESVVGFLGDKEMGKSTLAGALCGRRHTLVSDDHLVLDVDRGQAIIFPGSASMRLWPDSIDALGEQAADWQPLHPAVEKCVRSVGGCERLPLPLQRLYILNWGDRLAITSLTPAQAFLEVVRYTYPIVLHALDARLRLQHFDQCGRLIAAVKVGKLCRTKRLGDLSGVASLVERAVESVS